jgi:hypothetical protein
VRNGGPGSKGHSLRNGTADSGKHAATAAGLRSRDGTLLGSRSRGGFGLGGSRTGNRTRCGACRGTRWRGTTETTTSSTTRTLFPSQRGKGTV